MDEPGKNYPPSDDNGDFNPLYLLAYAAEIVQPLSDEEFSQLQEKIAAEKRMKKAVVNSSTATKPMFDYASSLNKCKWGGVNGSYPDYGIVSKQERLRKEKALKKPITEDEDPNAKKVKSFFCSSNFTSAEFEIPKKKRSSSLSGKLKVSKEEETEICYKGKATWFNGSSNDEEEAMQQNKKMKMDRPSSSKKKNSSRSQTSSDDSSKSKKRGCRKSVYNGPEPPPNLPDEFKKKIAEMGGSDEKLVIQKGLRYSDLTPRHNRMSIPFNQIREADFLTEEEKALLYRLKGKPATRKMAWLFDSKFEQWQISLRRWDMEKAKGKASKQYVLATKWHDLTVNNKLNENDVVQLWSFRIGLKLHFALVLVVKAEDISSS